jgi:hypothetical protein
MGSGKMLAASDDLGRHEVSLPSYHCTGLDVAGPAMRDFMIVSYRLGSIFFARQRRHR